MKSATLSLACALVCPFSVYAAAITEISITRTVSADAQAGGASVETVSGTASGFFEATRTDTDTNGQRSASVTSFQRTNFGGTASNIDFSGIGYVRDVSEGDLVNTIGISTADLFFTLDASFNYHADGFFEYAGDGSNFFALQLFRVLPAGETRVFQITWALRDMNFDGVLAAGRYHFKWLGEFRTSAPEFVPQSIDATWSILNCDFNVFPIPEASSMLLWYAGVLCLQSRRRETLAAGTQ